MQKWIMIITKRYDIKTWPRKLFQYYRHYVVFLSTGLSHHVCFKDGKVQTNCNVNYFFGFNLWCDIIFVHLSSSFHVTSTRHDNPVDKKLVSIILKSFLSQDLKSYLLVVIFKIGSLCILGLAFFAAGLFMYGKII